MSLYQSANFFIAEVVTGPGEAHSNTILLSPLYVLGTFTKFCGVLYFPIGASDFLSGNNNV